MNVLIVSKTKMAGNRRCIGGYAQDGTSIRLLTPGGGNWNTNAPFNIGEVWDLTYTAVAAPVPPHVEDVLVTQYNHVGNVPNLGAVLPDAVPAWNGGINQIFGGLLGFTGNHNGYISHAHGLPAQSTGFWKPDQDLTLRADGSHYDYQQGFLLRGLKYVGEPAAVAAIPAGTLVRVSLARWWRPPDAGPELEERCYLQLSGWF